MRLFNQEYWTIRNLEITNYSGDSNDYSKRRRGVVIALEDFGRGNGFDVSDLYIHDVLGLGEKTWVVPVRSSLRPTLALLRRQPASVASKFTTTPSGT